MKTFVSLIVGKGSVADLCHLFPTQEVEESMVADYCVDDVHKRKREQVYTTRMDN